MNFKRLMKHKYWIAGILAVVVLVGGYFIYNANHFGNTDNILQSNAESSKNNESQNSQNSNSNSPSNNTSTNQNSSNASSQQSSQTSNPLAPTDNTLNDVTLQAIIDTNDSYKIKVSLYGAAGKYDIDKKVDGLWVAVVTDANYVGTGGMQINDSIPSSETERTYRVYRVSEGTKIGPKEITIDRNLVQSNGIANFPRAQ